MSHLLKSVEDGVLKIVLSRPEAMNALSREMMSGLEEALEEAAGSREIGCVVVRGAGDKGIGHFQHDFFERLAGGGLQQWIAELKDNRKINPAAITFRREAPVILQLPERPLDFHHFAGARRRACRVQYVAATLTRAKRRTPARAW